MKDTYYFSAVKVGFYSLSLKYAYDAAGSWPDDAVEISTEDYQDFISNQPIDKMLGSESEGKPVWVDVPPPTKEKYESIAKSEKARRQADAQIAIAPLQDAVDVEDATDEEIALLKKWKQYSVAVNRLDTSTAPDITWPTSP